jgi:hypothetical protein
MYYKKLGEDIVPVPDKTLNHRIYPKKLSHEPYCCYRASALKILREQVLKVPFERRIPIGTTIVQDTHQTRPSV